MRLQGEGGAELLHGQTTADFKKPARVSLDTPRSATERQNIGRRRAVMISLTTFWFAGELKSLRDWPIT